MPDAAYEMRADFESFFSGVVAEVASAAEDELLDAEGQRPCGEVRYGAPCPGGHGLLEVYPDYGEAIEAVQDAWLARIEPRFHEWLGSVLPELEAELAPVFARAATAHPELARPEVAA